MKLSYSLFSCLILVGVSTFFSCEQISTHTIPKEDVIIVDSDRTELKDPEPLPDDPISNAQPTVDVLMFTEYPDEIDGCSCYFGKTAPELNEGKYVFMTNYQEKAFMILDGQMRVFDLVGSTNLESGQLMETWKNSNYDVVVKSMQTGQIDETWQHVGAINIKPKDKDATLISVVGECGC